MAMRPVEANWYRDFLFNLKNTKTRYDSAISRATSGKRLNNLSDSPADMAHVLTMRTKIDQIDQFDRNINSAYKMLSTAETALNQSQNLLYSVTSLLEQGASDTTDPAGRRTIAERINAIRDEMMNFANAEVMGKYVFAGSATDTIPFVRAADTTDVNGVVIPGVITYQGNGDTVNTQADFSVQVGMNIPGSTAFGTPASAPPIYDMFQRLADIVYDLRTDNTAALGAHMSSMDELHNQVSQTVGSIGGRTAHLSQIQGMLKSFRTSVQSQMSSLEDADMAEAISNLSKEEVGLQATLQAGARINRQSLMNFLT